MSITVSEFRNRLMTRMHARLSSVAPDNRGWTAYKVDVAIQTAMYEFQTRTNCRLTTTSLTLTSGDNTYDLTGTGAGTITNWVADQFCFAFIGNDEVEERDYRSIRPRAAAKQGKPRWLAFRDDDNMFVTPTPDQGYTLDLTHRDSQDLWTPGEDAGTEIKIPVEWIDRVVGGAKYYLIQGMPGHADWEAARQDWFATLAQAVDSFPMANRTGLNDRQAQRPKTDKMLKDRS